MVVECVNPGKIFVIFISGGDDLESLELVENEVEMVEVIDMFCKVLYCGKLYPGCFRWVIFFGSVVVLGVGLIFWLFNVLCSYVVGLVLDFNCVVIGYDVIGYLECMMGVVCYLDFGD